MCIYIYIYMLYIIHALYTSIHTSDIAAVARPISVLRFWISEGLTQAES